MRLASVRDTAGETRIVVLRSWGRTDILVDLGRATEALGSDVAELCPTNDMTEFLNRGDPAFHAAEMISRTLVAALDRRDLAVDDARAANVFYLEQEVDYLAPVPRPGKVICFGYNYRSHAQEMEHIPDEDLDRRITEIAQDFRAFPKWPSTFVGHRQNIVYPETTSELDYEAELCMVIGRRCKNVAAADYLDVLAGFTILNDVSMRDIQRREMAAGGFLLLGKNMDTTAPCGPFLVTPDEVSSPTSLGIRCRVNGEVRQDSTTSEMIHTLGEIVEYYSSVTLEPGDLITTSSPAGSAIGSRNPESLYLRPGDVVEIEIDDIGRLTNTVV